MDKPNHWVKLFIFKIKPSGWVCPYLTHVWVESTQHILECNNYNKNDNNKQVHATILVLWLKCFRQNVKPRWLTALIIHSEYLTGTFSSLH